MLDIWIFAHKIHIWTSKITKKIELAKSLIWIFALKMWDIWIFAHKIQICTSKMPKNHKNHNLIHFWFLDNIVNFVPVWSPFPSSNLKIISFIGERNQTKHLKLKLVGEKKTRSFLFNRKTWLMWNVTINLFGYNH